MSEITEVELQALVDGQLEAEDQVRVLSYLQRNPDAAERVLSDMQANAALQALCMGSSAPRRRHERAAKRLSRRIDSEPVPAAPWPARAMMGGLGAVMLLAVILLGAPHVEFGEPAAAEPRGFIEEALMSHRVALVRERMESQIEAPSFDPADVRTALQIGIPALPAGLKFVDAQVFPSDYGPSLQLVIAGDGPAEFSLFTVRAPLVDGVGSQPVMRQLGDADVSYWARAGNVYVLTGTPLPEDIQALAVDLADNQDAG